MEIIASNAIYLGEETGGKGRQFKSRFLVPGLVKYDYGVCLLTKENADKFIQGFTGCPVVVNHQDVTDENAKDVRVGVIYSVWFDEKDGYFWCEGVIWDKEAIKLINEGYSVSCQYVITEYSDNTDNKLHNGNPYDKVIENGRPEHLAIVNNPRYEGAIIAVNAINLSAQNEDKWITIHPNGEENKGRHLLIKDGENVYDAMRRQWGIETTGQQHLFDKRLYETNDDYKKDLYARLDEQIKKVREKEAKDKENEFKQKEEVIKKDATEMMLDKFINKYLDSFEGSYIKAMDYWEKYNKDYHTKAINEVFTFNPIDNITDTLYEALCEGIADRLLAINEDKWITIHPHGKEADDYRRLKIKDGETVEDAMHRQGYYDKRKAKDEKKEKQEQNKSNNKDIEKLKEKKIDIEEKLKQLNKKIDDEFNKINKKVDTITDNLAQKHSKDIGDIKEFYKFRQVLKDKFREESGFNKLLEERNDLIKEHNKATLSMNKEIAKENYTPSAIAGIKNTGKMTQEKANGGNVNPKYNKYTDYSINCQSCVVCYEARLRGYDVQTLPNTPGSKLRKLEKEYLKAWINPKTGEYAVPMPKGKEVKDAKRCYQFLIDNVEEGKRYNLGMRWKGHTRDGHVVTIYKENGDLILYDPQNGGKYKNKEMCKNYLNKIKYKTSSYGTKFNLGVDLYRIDDLSFNPEYMNDIMKGY